MADPQKRFQVVEETPDESQAAGLSLLLLSLKTLSQRALVAIDNLFWLLTVFSVFWLWRSTPDPNAYQIAGLTIYALFVLAANFIARRK